MLDRAVADLAATQDGLVSLAQLADLEIGRRRLRTAVEHGWLAREGAGVYGICGTPPSFRRQLWLGVLVLGHRAVVSHEAAGWLHGFDRRRDDRAEFTVPRARRGSRPGLVVHSTRRLAAVDRMHVDGLPCTTPTRTIIDLAATAIPRRRLEAAIDSAVRSGATSPIVLARRVEEHASAGAGVLRRLLPDSGGHSPLERRFLALMREAGLPRPAPQVVHGRDGRTYARVDFLFEPDVVVEVSGRHGHASDAERANDARRRNELQDAGRRVFEFTTADVFERPQYVVASMRARLRSGSWPDVRPGS